MSKVNSIATPATVVALGASAASAGTRDIHKFGEFFQNVKAEHVQSLLGGAAYVAHIDYDGVGREGASGGEVAIYWFTREGNRITCVGSPSLGYPYGMWEGTYRGADHVSKYLRTKLPLIATLQVSGEAGHEHAYFAEAGQ